MLKILLSLTFAALTLTPVLAISKSSGCGKPLSTGIKTGGTGSSNRLTLTSDGLERSYILHLPRNYSPNRPHGLIFSSHGRTETGAYQEKLSGFSNGDLNPHMLAVYPDGVDKQWQGDPDAKTDDVRFTLNMLQKISQQYCIDLEKVYASGKSNGGGFAANILACDPIASKKIAAFAGFAGAYYQKTDGSCNPKTVPITCSPGRKPVPIFEIHGASDNVIAYQGGSRRGRCLPSVPHFMTEWAKRNGLGNKKQSASLFGGQVVKYEFGKGDLKGINTHYLVKGLDHVWADTKADADGCCSVINGSELAMDFFKRWTLSAVAGHASGPSPLPRISSTKRTVKSTLTTKTAH